MEYIDLQELAKRLGIKPLAIRRMIESGDIKPDRVTPGSAVMWIDEPREDLAPRLLTTAKARRKAARHATKEA